MIPFWLTALSWLAIGTGVVSALVIAADIAAGHRQTMAIMNVVWPVTGLYAGPLAVWAYFHWARSRRPESGARPMPQAAAIGVSHCGSGCAVGDAIGETTVFVIGFEWFGSHLATVYTVDFTLAFLLGIVAQYFAIAPMRQLSVGEGIVAAVKADALSLAAFEVGMFAWMAVSSNVLFHPRLEPNQPAFWFMMQIAMLLGFATSYPANWWLISRGVKERM